MRRGHGVHKVLDAVDIRKYVNRLVRIQKRIQHVRGVEKALCSREFDLLCEIKDKGGDVGLKRVLAEIAKREAELAREIMERSE